MNRNRHSFALVELAVAICIVVTLSAGYATPALGQRRESTRTDSRSVITTAEIQMYGSNGSVHDLVHALRRQWLDLQQISLRETPTIEAQGKREARVTRASDPTLIVYLDNVKLGDIDELRSLPLTGVLEVRYFNAGQAMRRWGSGHEHGAIEVITTANAGTRQRDPGSG
ncbi:MAG TPA: hypothetical protein VIF83_04725 [Gemmatimonadaceae bacterium]